MKNILITGNKGFIGSNLEKKLSATGYHVYGTDLPENDVTAEYSLLQFKDIKFEKIFHLAGMTYIPDSWKFPEKFYHNNLTGTLRVLQFCRTEGTPLTFVSSYLYGHPKYLPIDENHPIQLLNPYHHSKYLAEQLCLFYQEYFNTRVVIIRPFNIYGPGQREDFLIPSIISQVLNDKVKQLKVNDLHPARDFLYIDDFTRALILSVPLQEGIFNIGSGSSKNVETIIKMILEISETTKKLKVKNNKRAFEIDDLYADTSKFETISGWKPEVSMHTGLKICIESERCKYLKK